MTSLSVFYGILQNFFYVFLRLKIEGRTVEILCT